MSGSHLREPNVWHSIMTKLSSMRDDEMMCDVKLVADDFSNTLKSVVAHSAFLAASSTFFRERFITKNKPPVKEEIIALYSLDTTCLCMLFDFIYGACFPTSIGEIRILREGSEILLVPIAARYLNYYNKTYTEDKKDKEVRTTDTRSVVYHCPLCDEKYAFKTNMTEHLNLDHSLQNTTWCVICNDVNEYGSMRDHILESHIQTSMSGEEEKVLTNIKPVFKLTQTYSERWEKMLSCSNCDKKFSDKSLLNQHLITIHKYIRCTDCKRTLKDEISRSNHIASCHSFSELQCYECHCTQKDKRRLVRHIFSLHGTERSYVCTICARRFALPINLSNHFHEQHEILATYAQIRAINGAITSLNLNEFQSFIDDDSVIYGNYLFVNCFPCRYCNKVFRSAEQLINDMKTHLYVDRETISLLDMNDYDCMTCAETFQTPTEYMKHRSQVHSRQYVCEICGVPRHNATKLALHMFSHSEERPFTCDKCGKRFKNEPTLHIHMLTHTNVRQFICQYCSRSYKSLNTLKKHISKDHEFSYTNVTCKFCKLKFENKEGLLQHIENSHNIQADTDIHKQSKELFQCNLCDKLFLSQTHYNTHRLTCH